MARVLAKAVLAQPQRDENPLATNLARAIEACHGGDKSALPKVLAKAMQAVEEKAGHPKGR